MHAPEQQPGCLGFLFKLLPGLLRSSDASTNTATPMPYRRKDYLLSKSERSFFGVLEKAVGRDYWLFPKIRIADLLWLPNSVERRQSHFNRIQAKHIDFVICDQQTVRPLLAIELDDSSHQRRTRADRDDFVDRALAAAGLPLLRVPAKASYHVAKLKTEIEQAIARARGHDAEHHIGRYRTTASSRPQDVV